MMFQLSQNPGRMESWSVQYVGPGLQIRLIADNGRYLHTGDPVYTTYVKNVNSTMVQYADVDATTPRNGTIFTIVPVSEDIFNLMDESGFVLTEPPGVLTDAMGMKLPEIFAVFEQNNSITNSQWLPLSATLMNSSMISYTSPVLPCGFIAPFAQNDVILINEDDGSNYTVQWGGGFNNSAVDLGSATGNYTELFKVNYTGPPNNGTFNLIAMDGRYLAYTGMVPDSGWISKAGVELSATLASEWGLYYNGHTWEFIFPGISMSMIQDPSTVGFASALKFTVMSQGQVQAALQKMQTDLTAAGF